MDYPIRLDMNPCPICEANGDHPRIQFATFPKLPISNNSSPLNELLFRSVLNCAYDLEAFHPLESIFNGSGPFPGDFLISFFDPL